MLFTAHAAVVLSFIWGETERGLELKFMVSIYFINLFIIVFFFFFTLFLLSFSFPSLNVFSFPRKGDRTCDTIKVNICRLECRYGRITKLG